MRIHFGLAVAAVAVWAVPALAQDCLHGSAESPEQMARRRDALTAARAVNTIQATQPGARERRYLTHAELGASPLAARLRDSAGTGSHRLSLHPKQEVVPGWKLTLDRTEHGYWFIIADVTDPCGFAWISNEKGLIFKAEALR